MSEAQKTIEINAPREKVFDVLCDYRAYPEFLGSLGATGIDIDRVENNVKIVTHHVKKMGKSVSYTLRYVEERPHRLSWSLVKGQMMSVNQGSWVLQELGESRTKVIHSTQVKFGLLVPQAIVNLLISKELPALLEAFKKRAES